MFNRASVTERIVEAHVIWIFQKLRLLASADQHRRVPPPAPSAPDQTVPAEHSNGQARIRPSSQRRVPQVG
jgi:hypothetical protein